jgi:hypothetical protein
MSNDEIEKENKSKKKSMSTRVSLQNPWPMSFDHKH